MDTTYTTILAFQIVAYARLMATMQVEECAILVYSPVANAGFLQITAHLACKDTYSSPLIDASSIVQTAFIRVAISVTLAPPNAKHVFHYQITASLAILAIISIL